MGQSILTQSIKSYRADFARQLSDIIHNYNLHRRFNMGDEVDYDELCYIKMMNKVLCSEDSLIVEYVQKKVLGQLEDCGIEVKDRRMGRLKKSCDSSNGVCGFNNCDLIIKW
jgi:hypothetical protein